MGNKTKLTHSLKQQTMNTFNKIFALAALAVAAQAGRKAGNGSFKANKARPNLAPFDADQGFYQASCLALDPAGNKMGKITAYQEMGPAKRASMDANIKDLDYDDVTIGMWTMDPFSDPSPANAFTGLSAQFRPSSKDQIRMYGVYLPQEIQLTGTDSIEHKYVGIRDSVTTEVIGACQISIESFPAISN